MIDRNLMVILLDYYGKLLSDKQYKTMISYYYDDLSLNEIADNQGISKQAVSVSIKRAEDKIMGFEQELKMYEKTNKLKNRLLAISEELDELSTDCDGREIIMKASNDIRDLANKIN
ncbi:MAG: hypothetical protein Q4P34_00935 [Tissierellia bacterium]|nr:hypothetical protein [Tissierellia bacterium]